MGSMNLVALMGNLGQDVELRATKDGTSVTTLRLATNEHYTTKAGVPEERTDWHQVVVWGRQAEACKAHLGVGDLITVTGRLQTREWTDKEGVKHWTTEVVANDVQFANLKKWSAQGPKGPPAGEEPPLPDAPVGTPF